MSTQMEILVSQNSMLRFVVDYNILFEHVNETEFVVGQIGG